MSEQLLLQQAIVATRAGRKAEARQLLEQILQANPRHEQVWLWMGAVIETDAERVKCLQQVLTINPNNAAARKGLAQLQARMSAAPATPQPATPPPATQCPHCGAANRAGAGFCSGCGQSLEQAKPSSQAQIVRCPGCGFDNPAGFRFCSKCGQRMDAAGPPLPLPAAPPQIAHPQPQRPQPQRAPAQAVPVPSTPPRAASYVQTLVRLNQPDLAMKHFKPMIKPSKDDKHGTNLQFVLEAAKICGAEAVSPLCNNIMREKRRWRIGKGSMITNNDPLVFLIGNITGALLVRVAEVSAGKAAAASMVISDNIKTRISRKVPTHVCMMVALHCYSTALATIASHDPAPVKAELNMRKKPLERAVIGLALAQSGDSSVEGTLKQLRSNSDWTVRLFAYEGLVVLADVTGRAPGPDQLAALQDRDVRVRTAVARVMASTGDATYTPHILTLADSSNKEQRRAIVPVIAVLASAGHQPAIVKLQRLAQGDSYDEVRESARAILQDVPSSAGL